MCLVLCVNHLRGMTLMAVVVSHQRICPVSMIHLYRICTCKRVWPQPLPSQADRLHMRLTTPPPSPLLGVLVDCFVLAVVIWDTMFASRVSLMLETRTLRRSVSPAQSESLFAKTEPATACFAASRPNCVASTDMMHGLPPKYLGVSLIFPQICFGRMSQTGRGFAPRASPVRSGQTLQLAHQPSVQLLIGIRHLHFTEQR